MAGFGLVGLVAAVATAAVIHGIEQSNAQARRSRSETLKELLGPSGEVGLELDAQMREQLAAVVAAGPRTRIVRIGTLDATEQLAPQGEGTFIFELGAMLAQDARSVVVQAEVIHARRIVEGRMLPSRIRYFLALSAPIQAATEEEAIAAWRAEDYAQLRQAIRAMVPELMQQLRSVLLDPEEIDYTKLPQVTSTVPGVSLVQLRLPNQPVRTVHVQGPLQGRLIRRTADRAHIVMPTMFGVWIWISLPATALPSAQAS
ncbi:hypothetical protein [Falsiroseomonas sp.]|uniref:hypothetical protein n=1 Tax=Falsiroseomonas sp. TaxID=2870721 RepID=UPI003F71D011